MKAHLKTTASVLVALAVGGLVIGGVTADNTNHPRISCSSPEVIDTLRALSINPSNLDPSVKNTGLLGMNGNELVCSADVGYRAAKTYLVLPLDNGQFRVTIQESWVAFPFTKVGPVDYLVEKRKSHEILGIPLDTK
jgi:hypothetical protein